MSAAAASGARRLAGNCRCLSRLPGAQPGAPWPASRGTTIRATIHRDDIDAHAHELGGKAWEPVELSFGETSFDYDVGGLYVAEPRESSFQLIDVIQVRPSIEECANPIDLRACCARESSAVKAVVNANITAMASGLVVMVLRSQ